MAAADDLGTVMGAAVLKAQAAGVKPSHFERAAMVAGFKFLLDRIEKLEALPMEYAGTYWPDKQYRKRQFVTHGGRVWACVAETTRNKPGLSEDWKLAVDKGRDAKEPR